MPRQGSGWRRPARQSEGHQAPAFWIVDENYEGKDLLGLHLMVLL